MGNLLLITGAGASHDSIDENQALVAGGIQYRPPLTDRLFTPFDVRYNNFYKSHYVTDCLKNNPTAYQVGYGIGLTKNIDPKKNFESLLYEFKNSNTTDKKLYWTVPIYLNELFTAISEKYLPGKKAPSNYYQLLLELNRSKYKKIIWINLNYDLLADYAIEGFVSKEFNKMSQYMDIEHDNLTIKYTKPHGSVNWYFRYSNEYTLYRDQIKSGDVPHDLESKFGEIYLDSERKYHNSPSFYPAIIAPIAQYDFIYKPHYKNIVKELKDVDSILSIGFSGKDKDILRTINEADGEVHKFMVVDKGDDSTRNSFSELTKSCSNIKFDVMGEHIYSEGFTRFCQGDLQRWLGI